MGRQASDDAGAFGPLATMFQNYFSACETLSRGTPPLGNGFPTAFDAQAFTTQAAAPLKAAARAQLEAMGLANRRLQAYMVTPTKLAQCRSPQDLINTQMAFWRTAFEQYTESGRKIAEAWGHALPLAASYSGGELAKSAHDYIDFNSAGAKTDARVPVTPPDRGAGRQRRVA